MDQVGDTAGMVVRVGAGGSGGVHVRTDNGISVRVGCRSMWWCWSWRWQSCGGMTGSTGGCDGGRLIVQIKNNTSGVTSRAGGGGWVSRQGWVVSGTVPSLHM